MQVSYLARPDLDAVVVELVAEEEAAGVALIETDRDDGAAAPHRTDSLVERTRVAGTLERDRDAVRAVLAFQLLRNILRGCVDRNEPKRFRDRQPLRDAIDRIHGRRSGCARDLREDETDRSAPEDDRRRAGVTLLGIRDGVHGDRQHLREVGAVLERQLRRQALRARVGQRERRELGVAPLAVDARARRNVRVAARHYSPGGAVAEHDGVILGRRAGREDAELRIPRLVQVRIARVAPDVRHLGPGADHRDFRPHPHHRRRQRAERIDVALHGAALGDANGPAPDLTALCEAVGQAHTRPASAIFDRTYFTDGGSTASASPDSDASSNDAYPLYLSRASAAKTGMRSRCPRPGSWRCESARWTYASHSPADSSAA